MSRSPSRDRSSSRAGRTLAASSGGGGGTYPDPVISSVAGSGQANAGNAIAQSIDGNDYLRWLSNTTTGTLTFTLTTSAVCVGYRIHTPHTGVNQAPKDWTFQGSPDNSVWTTLDTQTNVTGWTPAVARSFSFTNTTSHLYYRIVITANNGGANVGLGEMRLTPTPSGIPQLGSKTMIDWWDAGTITGRADGATVAFGDLIDQSGVHNFTAVVGTSAYRATAGPNSKPCIEHASAAGSLIETATNRVSPTTDVTLFAVVKPASTVTQQILGSSISGAALDISGGKYRLMKHGTSTVATSTTSHPVGSWGAVIVTYVSATGATKFRIIGTGTDVTDTIAGTATTFAETPVRTGWGSYDGTTNAAWRGSIAEMGRYASALGTTDLDTLASALKTKYGF